MTYDYNNRPEDQGYPSGGEPVPGTPQQQSAGAPEQSAPQTNGAYHYSGSGIPGGQTAGYGYPPQDGTARPQDPPQQPPQQPPYQASYQAPGPSDPMSGYNVVPPAPKKEKKSGGSKRVIALAIVCALIGGVGGGAAVGMALRGSGDDREDTVEAVAPPAETAENPNINSTVIDVTTNSEATDMTPQNVYESYVNAVVAISSEGTATNIFGQVAQTASTGSGFIITEDGYIVTNNHVVADADKLTVMMTSGEEYEATVIGADEENDVALIKIDGEGLPTVSIGSSDDIEVGQQVCAIGNPLGELTNTLTVGYVSALDREINENGTPINMFQTDCAINAGNSGGPIFDMHGNVVGITTAKYSSNGYSNSASIEGIGFCIPIDDAMSIVSDLLEYGYVKGRPALGIACQAISSAVTQYYSNLPVGIYVNTVDEGSAADKAGIQEGDIITAVDGTEVESVTDFKALLKNYSAGDTATLTVYRSSGGETLDLAVTFDEKNSGTQASAEQEQQTPQQGLFPFGNDMS